MSVWGHREYAPGRKPDPVGIDMAAFRRSVVAWTPPPPPTIGEDDMPGLHQLGAAMLAVGELYLNHRSQPPAAAERAAWSKELEARLARGEDPGPTLDYIAWALDQEKAKA
jgi:hypothetical protein